MEGWKEERKDRRKEEGRKVKEMKEGEEGYRKEGEKMTEGEGW